MERSPGFETHLALSLLLTMGALTTLSTITLSTSGIFVGGNSSSSSSSSSVSANQLFIHQSRSPFNLTFSELERGLNNWCNEKQGTAEYAQRMTAAGIIKECYSVGGTGLYLDTLSLTSIPEEIVLLRNLQEIDLRDNQLTSLPQGIFELQNLRRFHLESNQLTSIPERISQLRKLQHLNLANNRLTSLPEWMGQLRNLRWLYLASNQFISLPEWIGQLQNLEELDLSVNHLTSLPVGINQLQKLRKLKLAQNLFTSIPDWIFALPNHYIVDIRGCPFTSSELEKIRHRISSSSYTGPRIKYE
jgi:Leucine-rich repeat (LRR) protein